MSQIYNLFPSLAVRQPQQFDRNEIVFLIDFWFSKTHNLSEVCSMTEMSTDEHYLKDLPKP